MIINKNSTNWVESYQQEFKKVLGFMGLGNEGIAFYFQYLRNGRKGLSPYGKKEVYIDVTDGLPPMKVFVEKSRHELFHKRRELNGKEKFYDEILATMAEKLDFVAKGELPFPLKYLSRIFVHNNNSYKTSDMTLANP